MRRMEDTYEDAICMVEGHAHVNREAEAICSLRWQLAQAKKVNDTLQATCDAYEVRLGREMEHRPEIAEPEVPTLLAEVARLRAEEEKAQATFRALSGPILPELLVGIATGRVHLALQAQITMGPPLEGSPTWYERLDRVSRALTDAFLRMKDVYANGAGDVDAFYTARNAEARMIVAALDAAQADPRVGRLSGYDVRPVHLGAWASGCATLCPLCDWMAPTVETHGPWDAIITNPPFSLAEPFIRTALARVAPGGVVLMLVRMTFLGSLGRLPLWQEHPPAELAVIVPRPSFVGGGSDTNDYAFVVWAPGREEQRITWCTWAKPGRRR